MKNRKVIINGHDYSYLNTVYTLRDINVIIYLSKRYISLYRTLYRFKRLCDLSFFELKRFLLLAVK